jgi:ParB/RepB/Spo0J family partition protein
MSQPEVKVVPISSIRENPVALRNVDRDCEEYLGLRDSIQRSGILCSISVRKRSEDVDGTVVEFFEIVDGLHRYTAATDVGLDVIPVSVLELDKVEVLEAQIMANVHKVETKPVEYTKQIQRLLSLNPTLTISEMASRLAKSPSWLAQRLSLLKLEKSVQDLVDDDKITVANALALAKLPHEEQVNYVDQAITTKTDEFAPIVQARAKELKDAARSGRKAEPATFSPVSSLRKYSELKAENSNPEVGPAICRHAGVSTPEEGFALGVAYAIHLDPLSVAAQEAAYNEKKQRVEEAKKKRAAERAQKRAQEAAEAAAKASEEAGL